jgi:hypothetical protein
LGITPGCFLKAIAILSFLDFLALHKPNGVFGPGSKSNNLVRRKVNELVGIGTVEHLPKGLVIPIDVDADDRQLV